jgi:menaquinone-dependent protoporphyrinogen oxidase
VDAPNLLVAYQSVEGHTRTVAERIAERLRAAGALVTLVTADAAPAPTRFDGVVVGDPIHAGQHTEQLTAYLKTHAATLERVPTALFQVCLTSADHSPEQLATTGGYVAALTEATGCTPDLVARFAGALPYTRYGRIKRAFMRRIAGGSGHPTDTSRDHVLTDWDEVEGFADDVLLLVRSNQRS